MIIMDRKKIVKCISAITDTNLIATAGSDVLYYQYNNYDDVISVLDQIG